MQPALPGTPPRVLFCLLWRRSPPYGATTWGASQLAEDPSSLSGGAAEPLSHGLSNSAGFVVGMLNDAGVEARLVHVLSDNDIWKAIEAYAPTHVVIEAFWCRPKKFDDLRPLFPGVHFIVRGHSSTPFLAHDTYGFKWAMEYLEKPGVVVAPNDPRHVEELRLLGRQMWPHRTPAEVEAKIPYLPNYYPPVVTTPPRPQKDPAFIDIGCFGAARPFKNMVGQGLAAMAFAEKIGRRLRFHINGDRIECGGGPTVKNLEWIFAASQSAELVRHDWSPHADFLALIRDMDLVLQVSFAETFCIVAADAVSQDVPLVGSAEIPWLPPEFCADPTRVDDMVRVMGHAWTTRHAFLKPARAALNHYVERTRRTWLRYLRT